MYLPYLRGKQFELIALREFIESNPGNINILPIIEPVKSSYNGIKLAIKCFFKVDFKFALIINPSDGDFKKSKPNILADLSFLLEDRDKWIPAFKVQNSNLLEVQEIISQHNLQNIMLVINNSIDIENKQLYSLLSNDAVLYIVCSDDNTRSTFRRLKQLNKNIIPLGDKFNEQKRNADYSRIDEELFSDEFINYKEDDFFGFSDYTPLSKNFIEGGMLPYAIAIHITYKKKDDEVWVKHFVSDTNDSQSNIQGKFFEANNKLKHFFDNRDKTVAINEIIQMLNKGQERYPGLGVIKKISIRNHIELMNNILAINNL